MEKQREFSEKLQELFDDLTQTENRLIGHQQQAVSAKSVGDLQQYQQEHQVQPGHTCDDICLYIYYIQLNKLLEDFVCMKRKSFLPNCKSLYNEKKK